jgi:hypothetical protein
MEEKILAKQRSKSRMCQVEENSYYQRLWNKMFWICSRGRARSLKWETPEAKMKLRRVDQKKPCNQGDGLVSYHKDLRSVMT